MQAAFLPAGLLALMSAFQAALAAGAPWGAASWGGKYSGKLPARLRLISFLAAVIYAVAAVLLCWQKTASALRRVIATACVLVGIAGVIGNALSPSKTEKLWSIWAAALAWSALPLTQAK